MSSKILVAPRLRGSAFASDLLDKLAETPAVSRRGSIVVVGMPRLAVLLAAFFGRRVTLLLDGAEPISDRLAAQLRKLRVASFSFSSYSKLRAAGVDAAFFDWAPDPRAAQTRDQGIFVTKGLEPARHSAREDAFRLLSKPRWLRTLLRLLNLPAFPSQATFGTAGHKPGDGVYVASPRATGLDNNFYAAMAAGFVVLAPDDARGRQYVTHGVSGLIAGHAYAPPPERGAAISAMAARTMRRARQRFETDRARLRAFTAGEPIARRTIAQVEWPPASTGAPAPADATQGGARTRGVMRDDLPGAPLITVAVVVRNARDSFAPTLSSILAQDYPNFEVVAVDGASTDGTRDEIAARDDMLDYWISERDGGPYEGMNRAARLARGRFLIFMNAGDFFPHASAITQAFEDPETFESDVVVGHHIYVDAHGVERLHKGASFEESWRNLCAGDISWDWLAGIPCGQAVFIRSQLLRDQPFDTSYRICSDHAFLYEARRRGRRFAHCDSVIGVYTSGGLSGSDDTRSSRELLRCARAYGPREKIDAWFSVNMPYGFYQE